MAIELTEGMVGWAKSTEELKYPSVTSCLTVTCVTSNGGKAGAHLSIFKKKNGLDYKDVLPALILVLGASRSAVKKVWIVGQLTTWKTTFEPATTTGGSNDPNAIQQSNSESTRKAMDHLRNTLKLQHLKEEDQFQFVVLDGTFSFPVGGNHTEIELNF